jgi:hypothetical protein
MGLGLRVKTGLLKNTIRNSKESVCRYFIERKAKENIENNGVLDIPIIINNYNRYNAFVSLVDWFKGAGFRDVIILDNNSNYPPLLEYYKKNTFCNIIYLGNNVGHTALWDTGFYKKICNSYFCYTDPDVVPVEECPSDLVARLLELLWKYPEYLKAGPGLRLSDIPDCYGKKDSVLLWESQFWENPIEKNVYKAKLDTTFAIYRPRVLHGSVSMALSLRTGEPYVFHHTPWYEDTNNLSHEEAFYQKTAAGISWWSDPSNLGPDRVKKMLHDTK